MDNADHGRLDLVALAVANAYRRHAQEDGFPLDPVASVDELQDPALFRALARAAIGEIAMQELSDIGQELESPTIIIEHLGGNCPVQAEGTINGKRFYLAFRK